VIHRLLLCGLLTLVACKGNANSGAAPSSGPLRTNDEKTLYSLGLLMGQRMGDFNLTPAELAVVERGISDQVLGRPPAVQLREWGPRINEMAQARSQARGEQEKARGREFAERASHETGAVRTPSGLVYKETRAGTGPQPTAEDTVRVHYRGTLTNGTEFDTTRGGEPAEFPLRGVVPCWTEGMQRMRVGGTAKLVCPSDIAYGDRGQRAIPPGATLVFEVELLAIVPRPATPEPALGLPGMPGMPPGAMPPGAMPPGAMPPGATPPSGAANPSAPPTPPPAAAPAH
jgi:FKBP-type peptidyl-prolyl cis-trans isomerase FkpA